MRTIKRSALVARAPETVFGVIADVRRYPEFVPACRAARVEAASDTEVVATLEIRQGPLDAAFTTRNRLEPHTRIAMSLVDGPFSVLEGAWSIQSLGADGCRIELDLCFEFARGFPAVLLDPFFEGLAQSLVDAFVQRARAGDRA
jgi:ribosome-associated toxin RatA of RatAB toxin-antitoxin module